MSIAENTSVVVCPENTSLFGNFFYVVETLNHNMFIYFLLRDQDNSIIRPLPKIKRMISDNACLPHIVQVFAQSESDFLVYTMVSYPLRDELRN